MAMAMAMAIAGFIITWSLEKIFKYMIKFMSSILVIKDICEIISHSLVIV